jgi:beta-glucosidase
LKGFQRLRLKPGEQRSVVFTLASDDLAFYGAAMGRATEPGQFQAWIGGSSAADLRGAFEIMAD